MSCTLSRENSTSNAGVENGARSIVSLFDSQSTSPPINTAGDITALVSKGTGAQEIAGDDICISECGGIQLTSETVQECSSQPLVTLFQMNDSKYVINDLPTKVSKNSSVAYLYSYLQQHTLENSNLEDRRGLIEDATLCSSLNDPDSHRKSLAHLASQMKKSNELEYMFPSFLTPHFLLKGLVKGLPDTTMWLDKAIAHLQQVVHTYENQYAVNQEDIVTPAKGKITLDIFLQTKQVLGEILQVKDLWELSQEESGCPENRFNRFVYGTLKSLIPGWQSTTPHYATASDAHLLLLILQKPSIGQLMVRSEMEGLLNEESVSNKKVQKHCIEKNELQNVRVFREIAYQDYRRMQFEKLMKEKTSSSITRICKGFVAENYMWPYSCVYTSPLLRLPARWESMDFPLLLHHAVLRSYETQRLTKSALRYANGGSSIIRNGNLTFRKTNRHTLLLLEGNVFPKSEVSIDNLWKERSRSSVLNFSEADYYKRLTDIDEGQIKCVIKPVTNRLDIRARVKQFREMCSKNKDIVRRRFCIQDIESESEIDEEYDAQDDLLESGNFNSSDEEAPGNYMAAVNRNYTVPISLRKDAIHKKILSKLARKYPDSFTEHLKPVTDKPSEVSKSDDEKDSATMDIVVEY